MISRMIFKMYFHVSMIMFEEFLSTFVHGSDDHDDISNYDHGIMMMILIMKYDDDDHNIMMTMIKYDSGNTKTMFTCLPLCPSPWLQRKTARDSS